MEKHYHTKQKGRLLAFLSADPERQLTIEEIASELPEVGKSTVYRLVRQLVEDGTLRRFVADNSRKFLYQYAGCRDCSGHLHLKCTVCGKLIHLQHGLSHQMEQAIASQYDFSIDGAKTMLFGCCRGCRGEAGKERA